MKKVIFISYVIILTVLLVGCTKAEPNISTQENTQSIYYGMTEIIVNDSESTIDIPDGGKVESLDPVLIGGRIYRNASVTDYNDNSVNFYTQIWDMDVQEWTHISMLNNGFCIDGVEYDGFDSYLFNSTNGEMYTSAYVLEQGRYIGRMGADSIAEIVCEIPREVESEWNGQSGAGMLTKDCEGNFYHFSEWSDTILCYDAMLQKQKTITVPKFVYGIIQGAAGSTVYWYGCDTRNKPVVESITDEKILLEEMEGLTTDYYAEISEEGILFLADTQNVWRVEMVARKKCLVSRKMVIWCVWMI